MRSEPGRIASRGAVLGLGILSRVELEAFELVVLRRPAGAPSYDTETLKRIQSEHVAYHAMLRDAGTVVTNGPVTDQPDESVRGFTFYRTGSLAEARRLAEADPAVQAGRLVVDVMTWYCPGGDHDPERDAGRRSVVASQGGYGAERARPPSASRAIAPPVSC